MFNTPVSYSHCNRPLESAQLMVLICTIPARLQDLYLDEYLLGNVKPFLIAKN
jgi:hypothetical protein